MRTKHPLSRFIAALAVAGLVLGPGGLQPARAQADAGGPPAGGDPPARVGRVARLSGTVSFHAAGEDTWQPATLNYPVTSGDAFWTQPQSAADIEVATALASLDETTEFDIDTLDDHNLAATEPEGRVYLRLGDTPAGDTTAIRTPRGVVSIAGAGRYEVVAGDTEHPTTVTVVDGSAQVSGDNLFLSVGPQQTASITGTDTFIGRVGAQQTDPFLAAALRRERPQARSSGGYTPPPVVAQMTGSEALEETGEWAPTPDYGQVWYPPVDPGWVPYRNGHWAWVAPWGWTWVDDAPWGFAPFHYGRWIDSGGRWGWTPVIPSAPFGEEPVYAPALVSWADVAAGAAVGVVGGLAIGAAVGWIPLGPREFYRPPYRCSDRYVRRVNVANVTNVSNITNVTNVNNFVNRAGATVVPAAAVTGSAPIAPQVRPIAPTALASLRPVPRPPVAPTVATAGVTPAVARQLNLSPAPSGATPRPASPGPAVGPNRAGALPLRAPGSPSTAVQGASVPGAAVRGEHVPEHAPGAPIAPPGSAPRPGAGVAAGAAAGAGAAALGGAALLGRQGAPRPGGLPALAAPHTGGAPPIKPGAAPGPPIVPHGPPLPATAARRTPLSPTAPGAALSPARPNPPPPSAPGLARAPGALPAVPQAAAPQTVRPTVAPPSVAVAPHVVPPQAAQVPHVAPPPAVQVPQHVAPPVAQVPHYAPTPQRAMPQPMPQAQYARPAVPAPRFVAPPPAPPRPAPPPHACPPGRPNC